MHNKELHNLCTSQNIIRVIKSSGLNGRGVCHAIVWQNREMHKGLWWGKLYETGHFEDRSPDMRMLLKQILEKWKGRASWS